MFLEEGGTTLEIKNYNQKKKNLFLFFFLGPRLPKIFYFFSLAPLSKKINIDFFFWLKKYKIMYLNLK